jgi:hypothetical protein
MGRSIEFIPVHMPARWPSGKCYLFLAICNSPRLCTKGILKKKVNVNEGRGG